jgi:hypothetical protein
MTYTVGIGLGKVMRSPTHQIKNSFTNAKSLKRIYVEAFFLLGYNAV